MRTLRSPLIGAALLGFAAPVFSFQVAPAQDAPSPGGWWERLRFTGDLRLRHESSFNLPNAPGSPSSRHRERLRARLGLVYESTDEFSIEARLRTGDPDNPQNPYVDLGGTGGGEAFDSFTLSLDRINARYSQEHWWVVGGKFGHPFWTNPVYGELVWDADVNPDGVAAGWFTRDWGLESVRLTAGQYVLLEQAAAEDAFATVLQASASQPLAEGWGFRGALGYYHYYDATPGGSTVILKGENSGNATDPTGSDFVSEFGVLNPIAAFTYGGAPKPLTFAGEYFRNLRAEIDEDQGFALGVAYGSTGTGGDWQLAYQWQLVEQDAVFTPFSGDDFTIATNYMGHVLSWTYMFEKSIGLRLWALLAAPDSPPPGVDDELQYRVRADLTVSF